MSGITREAGDEVADDDALLYRLPPALAAGVHSAGMARATLADLDPLALSTILSLTPDPVDAAALAASCTAAARAGSGPAGLWRALTVDARGVPDSRAPPPPARGGRGPATSTAARTRAAAAEVSRWLAAGGRGAAAQRLDLAWHPAVAASAAVAEAALAGVPGAACLVLDAGPAGALSALPKALSGDRGGRAAVTDLTIAAGSLDSGALTSFATGGGLLPALAATRGGAGGVRRLRVEAALTGWAPLLPLPSAPASRGRGAAALPRLHTLELVGTGIRELPPALASATALTRLAVDGARLGRDRWSAAATGSGGAWSPCAVLARLAATLADLELAGCGLETVPPEVGACTGLTRLGLARNALRSFSCAALAGLPRLEALELEGNALGAPLPARLVAGLPALREVGLAGNPYLVNGMPLQRQHHPLLKGEGRTGGGWRRRQM